MSGLRNISASSTDTKVFHPTLFRSCGMEPSRYPHSVVQRSINSRCPGPHQIRKTQKHLENAFCDCSDIQYTTPGETLDLEALNKNYAAFKELISADYGAPESEDEEVHENFSFILLVAKQDRIEPAPAVNSGYSPNTTFHLISPVLRSTALSVPHGGSIAG